MGNDPPVTQSPRGLGGNSKVRKTKAPAYTPEQRAFLRAASLEVATAERVQERFNEKFPENKKEIWDIRKEKTKATQGKSILEVKREAAANLQVGNGKPLSRYLQRKIKMEEARVRNRIKKEEFEARQSGLYVPKTPPRPNECLEDNNDNLEAFLRELDMDSEDEHERMEVAIKAENEEKHDQGEMSSDEVLIRDTA
ncbi:hypothetical protein MMC17_000564 [Xylographa soralifera]|nr:hypothetical protein [Xylographa soralifera]